MSKVRSGGLLCPGRRYISQAYCPERHSVHVFATMSSGHNNSFRDNFNTFNSTTQASNMESDPPQIFDPDEPLLKQMTEEELKRLLKSDTRTVDAFRAYQEADLKLYLEQYRPTPQSRSSGYLLSNVATHVVPSDQSLRPSSQQYSAQRPGSFPISVPSTGFPHTGAQSVNTNMSGAPVSYGSVPSHQFMGPPLQPYTAQRAAISQNMSSVYSVGALNGDQQRSQPSRPRTPASQTLDVTHQNTSQVIDRVSAVPGTDNTAIHCSGCERMTVKSAAWRGRCRNDRYECKCAVQSTIQ